MSLVKDPQTLLKDPQTLLNEAEVYHDVLLKLKAKFQAKLVQVRASIAETETLINQIESKHQKTDATDQTKKKKAEEAGKKVDDALAQYQQTLASINGDANAANTNLLDFLMQATSTSTATAISTATAVAQPHPTDNFI
jgi:hypothetical protein